MPAAGSDQPVVLDASAALSLVLPDEVVSENLPALIATRPIVTPPLFPAELANGLTMAVGRERLSAAAADRAARLLQSLPIVTVTTDYTVLDLLRRSMSEDISSYDAAYLQLAMRLGATLATADSQLRARAVALGLGVT